MAQSDGPVGRLGFEEVAVRLHLRIVGQIGGVCNGPQMHSGAQHLLPVGAGPRREERGELLADRGACSRRPPAWAAFEQVLATDGRGEDRPEALGLEHHQHEALAVVAEVGADERVRRGGMSPADGSMRP